MNGLTKELKWLHISDFHCKEGIEWSQDIVLKSLLDDVEQKYSDGSKPDLIFVTGDISFSGKKAEFKTAQNFIDKLSDVTTVEKDNIFFVPGNHDVDRAEEEDTIVGARIQTKNLSELDRLCSNSKRLKTLYNRQKNYREFANANRSENIYSDESYAHHIEIEVKSIKIKILLLDSAWLAHDDSDFQKLAVGVQQIKQCVGENNHEYLVIALMHHPVSWLKGFEELLIENALIKDAHIVLRGHVHQGDTSSIEKNNERLVVFTAGASYESRTSVNSYSFGRLDLLTGKGEKFSHSYSGTTNDWSISGTDLWNLKLSPVLSSEEIYSLVSSQVTTYPNYISCLINNFKTDVPQKCNGKYVLLNKSTNLNLENEVIIDLVVQLQWLTCFKYTWEDGAWKSQFNKIVLSLEAALILIKELVDELENIERASKALLCTLLGTSNNDIDSINNSIADFISAGEFNDAYQLIKKWEYDLELNNNEIRYLKRKKLEVAVTEGSDENIKLSITYFEDLADLDVMELLLLSTAYYQVKMYPDAETRIIQVLDIDEDSVRTEARSLARAIAGQTGNKQLVDRVM